MSFKFRNPLKSGKKPEKKSNVLRPRQLELHVPPAHGLRYSVAHDTAMAAWRKAYAERKAAEK